MAVPERLTKAEKRRCARCGFAYWQHSDSGLMCPFRDDETFKPAATGAGDGGRGEGGGPE